VKHEGSQARPLPGLAEVRPSVVLAKGGVEQPPVTHFDSRFGFEAFASHPFYRAINRSLVEAAFQRLPASASNRQLTIVDVGCGTGLITSIVAEVLAIQGRKATVVAIDPDPRALEVARKRAEGLGLFVRFVEGSPSDLSEVVSNADVVFFCNAIHLVADKKAAISQIASVLSPEGIVACNTSFFHGTYVEGTERFYRLWTRKALAWLKRENPAVRLSREEKAVAMQWLRADEYTALLDDAGLVAHPTLQTADMHLDAWRDLGQYRMFIEGALPGAPLPLGAAALEAAVYEVGRELGIEAVPRRWLQLVAARSARESSSGTVARAVTGHRHARGGSGVSARDTKTSPPLIGPEGTSYEELEGAQGREVFFRPHRYQRQDLGPVRPVVHVSLAGDRPCECSLVDVSQNGVAFEWPSGRSVEVGAVIGELVVSFDDNEAYRGEARVGSVREAPGTTTIVGVSFADSLMNMDDVLQLRDVRAWRSEGAEGLSTIGKGWRVPGNERFKSLVAELRLFLEDAEKQFAELEASIPWHVAHGETDSLARDALVSRIKKDFVSEVVRMTEDIDAAVRTASLGEVQALKEYSIRHVHKLLMNSPWMHRALHKPLGYPGDYEIMNGLYERHFEGHTLFAKAVNLAMVSTRAAVGVRSRKDLLKDELSRLIDAQDSSDRPFRILSVAAGPAQEVYELLRDRESLPRPIEVVLFDQDKGALAYAYGRLKRLMQAKWPEGVTVVYLHDSIRRLLRDSSIFAKFGQFDAIFSCGLFDYLQLPTAVALSRNLFASVTPGGALYVGNVVPTLPTRWVMEFHLNWHLIYRTRGEMADLGRVAMPSARIDIKDEPAGVNPFLVGTRI